jgi:N-acetylmuramoyl-L-alanine amidase
VSRVASAIRARCRSWLSLILAIAVPACAAAGPTAGDPLRGRTIVVDAGHGGTAATDTYRVGPAGEREEWVNLRVAHLLRDMLEARGARVILTRDTDTAVELRPRAELARDANADVFISIHHNATADPAVNFPIIYYHGHASQNVAGVRLARHVAGHLNDALFAGKANPVVVSDHVIFDGSGTAVLRHSYGIPGVIGEASFFTDPEEERRLRDPAYNRREAEAYVLALQDFFSEPMPPVHPADEAVPLEPFRAAQEAERMAETARRWRQDYLGGRRLMQEPERDLEQAFELLTRSVRSFPDSPVAGEAHLLRASILDEWGRAGEAAEVRRRVRELYAGPQR